MSSTVRPTGIRLDKPRSALVIPWNDGHTSEYSWNGLREACPCAGCRGGHINMGVPSDPMVLKLSPVRSYVLERGELVGNYALRPIWSDGHETGIYTWDYLRGLQPP